MTSKVKVRKTSATGWNMRFEVNYSAKEAGSFEWRLLASNGRVMAISSEIYSTLANANA